MSNLAWTAALLAESLETSDVAFLCDDDQQAESLAAALAAMAPDNAVIFLPSSDALPGDRAPASPANIGRRVAALRRLRMLQLKKSRRQLACIFSGEAAARLYPPPAAFDQAPPILQNGTVLDMDVFESDLTDMGYIVDDRVDEPGEVAVRGEVIDIFPVDAGLPARIEIADGKIASLRSYDPVTQRSVDTLDRLEIGRAAEPAVEPATSLLDHLPNARMGFSEQADKRRLRFIALATDAATRAVAPRDAVADTDWHLALASHALIEEKQKYKAVPRFAETTTPLQAFRHFVKTRREEGQAVILAGSVRDLRFLGPRIAKRLKVEWQKIESWTQAAALPPATMAMLVAPVPEGFVSDKLVLVAAADLLGSRAALQNESPSALNPLLDAGSDIRTGDVVVHEDHGVGLVVGLEQAPGTEGEEMIALEYAGGARRLVPVNAADRIWRYGADADAVTLDKLDGSSWAKRRADIDAAIRTSAEGLAALADGRAKLTAAVIEPDSGAYERFASGFAFNETADQARAISAVRDDLASGRPMDRLVIGDVGYGKTEVALRAAALAALAGYQVIVAAPTTVLVRQHLDTFAKRFAEAGIAVAGLSRLSTPAEKKAVKAGLADGSIRIVIGTGAVMAKDVRYRDLALVIIDEEQRFGASDKAKLRGEGDSHLLSLSATPIPRTLQMALVGLQKISVIATPPARRQPIRTSLDTFDDARIRTALIREKTRGGQSFVVVSRIEDMAKLSERLARIVPDFAIVQAHGKMPVAEIDKVMVGFADGQGDILLATNIIEAGLDVPRANTMIVWRADRFGLAQLHQLRGRVGRGNRRGQVLLLTDDEKAVADRTLKRLRTLATFDRLGAGFEISARDLDMRGAGDLLGETQAGHMKLIGTDLYQNMLGIALRRARGETVERWTPDLRIGGWGALPQDWIPEPDIRIGLYVRLARAEDDAALDTLEDEMVDRFGPLPTLAALLLRNSRIGVLARRVRISRIDAGPAAIAITPRPDFCADGKKAGLQEKDGRLLLIEELDTDERQSRLQDLLESLEC
ncbi:DEAD/DEAH box helicase [Sphingobium sufflavum]|uniref:helicase-related protein n=1 Tax=Sphingobium sufflavum TaxID=1129547 RepID=UPI001F23E4E9|nr:helicase-related protein [Sphingobium sufflavum]MCE7798718.1 DEAD/DEAH box helicase [Sphingobium sufflavum]